MYEELVKRLRGESEYADLVAYMHGIHHTRQEDITAEIAKSWKELFAKAADAIEELLRKEKFHAFLWNVINPNDMQLYLEMYHSGDEKEDAG